MQQDNDFSLDLKLTECCQSSVRAVHKQKPTNHNELRQCCECMEATAYSNNYENGFCSLTDIKIFVLLLVQSLPLKT